MHSIIGLADLLFCYCIVFPILLKYDPNPPAIPSFFSTTISFFIIIFICHQHWILFFFYLFCILVIIVHPSAPYGPFIYCQYFYSVQLFLGISSISSCVRKAKNFFSRKKWTKQIFRMSIRNFCSKKISWKTIPCVRNIGLECFFFVFFFYRIGLHKKLFPKLFHLMLNLIEKSSNLIWN